MVDRERAQIEPLPDDPAKPWNDRAMCGRTRAVGIYLYSIVGAFVALVKLYAMPTRICGGIRLNNRATNAYILVNVLLPATKPTREKGADLYRPITLLYCHRFAFQALDLQLHID